MLQIGHPLKEKPITSMTTQIENRMINTRTPKRDAARERMKALAPQFKVNVWDNREKGITTRKAFLTNSDRNTFLHTNCIQRGLRYFHKDSKGRLDMELEYLVK